MPKEPFLSRFADDIFISYTHIDNKSFGEHQNEWVNDLYKLLGIRVEQLLGEAVQVWMDPKLQGNDEYADALLEKLERVGLLVCVISPRYLKSPWCLKELQGFLRACAQNLGTHVGTQSRVFKVIKTPVVRTDEPESLKGMLGYPFYHEVEPGKVREFHLDPSPDGWKAYWARIDDLALDITGLLKQVEATHASAPAANALPPGATVYLAESSSDLSPQRDEIRRDLVERRYRVLPTDRLPQTVAEALAAIETDLDQSVLSIHPIGRRYGARPEDDDRSLAHLQLEVAHRRATQGDIRQLIWLPRGVEPADDRQKQLVALLQTTFAAGGAVEHVAASLEGMKTHVVDALQPAAVPSAPAPLASSPAITVYVMCHRTDAESIQPIEDALRQQGLSVLVAPREGAEADIAQLHRDSLVECDAVIIYYGRPGEAWLRSQLLDLIKARGWGRSRPFLSRAVYVAAPMTAAKERYRDTETMVLRGGDVFDPGVLTPFVSSLRATGSSKP